MIDIGGVAMLRAAAKNHAHVGGRGGPGRLRRRHRASWKSVGVPSATSLRRRQLARKAFAHCSSYDDAVVAWLDAGAPDRGTPRHLCGLARVLPGCPRTRAGHRLRVGRPGRSCARGAAGVAVLVAAAGRGAALRGEPRPGGRPLPVGCDATSWWDSASQLGGKQLSYLNVYDSRRGVAPRARPRFRSGCGRGEARQPVRGRRPRRHRRGVPAGRTPATRSRPSAASWRSTGRSRPRWRTSLAEVFTEVVVAPGYDAGRTRAAAGQAQPPHPAGRRTRVPRVARAFAGQTRSWCRPHRLPTMPASDGDADSGLGGGDRPVAPSDGEWSRPRIRLAGRRGGEFQRHRRGEGSLRRRASAPDSRTVATPGGIAATKAGDRGRGGAYASDAFLPFADGLDGARGGGLHRRRPARRVGARRRGHRGRQPRGPRHGVHRPTHIPPLRPGSGHRLAD